MGGTRTEQRSKPMAEMIVGAMLFFAGLSFGFIFAIMIAAGRTDNDG